MLADKTLCIKVQQAGTANALLGTGAPALQAKAKFPGQKGLPLLYQPLGDDKTRLLQRVEHMGEDAGDCGYAAHLVERILEVRIARVIAVESLQMVRSQLFVELDEPLHCGTRIG